MRRLWIVLGLALIVGAGLFLYSRSSDTEAADPTTAGQGRRGGPGGGPGARPAVTIELGAVKRGSVTDRLSVVGTLVGEATVDVASKASGRLTSVFVRLGDPVRKGQRLAQVDDREVREQVRQAEASYEVARATIRQREADLGVAQSNLERSKSLFERAILPRQTLEDAEARAQAATAQLDLARAQFAQAGARVQELRLTLANTQVLSPVNGYVGKRHVDPGASVSPTTPIVSVVDISLVRLVVNLVEKDLRRVQPGVPAEVQVDAYPGETFTGQVARVAPVLDPATRTAEMEIEIPNPGGRLKPGMYARVQLTTERHENALVVPRNAIVDIEGRRGVFVPENRTARFREIRTGIEEPDQVEVLSGLGDGQRVITTGAAGLREGDPVREAVGRRPPGNTASTPTSRGPGTPRPPRS